eukprot:CAMPEP_0172455322 /NCGR_PEP_ID=MMETSP1065-20121228/12008_1 /TAXON_ID=265537 /ORGANISM="Amphiprora paludosa, Strain CCMP125" /LENGTH=991 /DNA_ID=CAMNT_0013207783 /DNA_START=28 /DNA_END=3003 /DNA_ORIENTATION=+
MSQDAAQSSLNQDFEANLHHGMIWASVEADAAVLAVALSRQAPTLECTTPPLYLAVGTHAGTCTVTELLPGETGARLGSTTTLVRPGRLRSLDFAPDGALACGGDDGLCALIVQGQVVAEIPRVDRIYAVQFSPDAQYLAIGGYDATVAIVDVTCRTAPLVVADIPVDGLISTVDWSPDGQWLAIGGSDKLCTLVETTSWQIVHDLRRPAAISCCQWHPNSRYLAIGSTNVVVVDRETWQIQQEISLEGNPRINDLCWSPGNGHFLVVCGNQHSAKLLETKTYSTIQDIRRQANITSTVWGQQECLSSVPHRFLAMGGDDQKVLILKAGLSSGAGGGTGSSIGDDTSAASSYLSNRGDWVLKENAFADMDESGGADPLLLAQPQGDVQKLSGTVHVVSFSRGSKSRPSAFFAAACDDGTVALRSTIGWSVLCRLEFLNPMTCIAFSNGSRIMACGSSDGKVQIIATAPVWTVATVIDAGAPVTNISFSKNNERLAIVGNDGFLGLVDPQDNFSLSAEMELDTIITAVEWSSKCLAVAQEDGTVSIYPVADVLQRNFNEIEPITLSQPTPVRSLTFGYRGRLLAVGGDDGVVAIYNTDGEWPVVHSISVDFSIALVRWSPTGRHLAIAGHNNDLKVVDTVFWAEIEELNKFFTRKENSSSAPETSLTFSQDGKFLAFTTNHHSGTRIVNTITWELVLDLEGTAAGATAPPSASSVLDLGALQPGATQENPPMESFHDMVSQQDDLEHAQDQEMESFQDMVSLQDDLETPQDQQMEISQEISAQHENNNQEEHVESFHDMVAQPDDTEPRRDQRKESFQDLIAQFEGIQDSRKTSDVIQQRDNGDARAESQPADTFQNMVQEPTPKGNAVHYKSSHDSDTLYIDEGDDDAKFQLSVSADSLEVAPSLDERAEKAVQQYKLAQLRSESLTESFIGDEDEPEPLARNRSGDDEDTVEEYDEPASSQEQYALRGLGSDSQDDLPVGSDLFKMTSHD